MSPKRWTKIASSSLDPFLKWDLSAFTEHKDDKRWDQRYHSTWAQALAQDLSEILETTYKPSNKQETELFEEKQKYMFAVLEKTLKTNTGKTLVRSHINDHDTLTLMRKKYGINYPPKQSQ